MNRRSMIGSLTLFGLAVAGSAVAALNGPSAPKAGAEGCCPACPCPCCGGSCTTDAVSDKAPATDCQAVAVADPC